MIKYDGDSLFSRIDQYTGSSGFITEKGTINAIDIVTTSITGDLSTYADNQVYQVEFTTTHFAPQGGFIKFKLPDAFDISSESSAVSKFKVLDDPKSSQGYANIQSAN